MSDEAGPEGLTWLEHGWRLECAGVLDPRPGLPAAPIAMALIGVLAAWFGGWWLLFPFLILATATVDLRGGLPIGGLQIEGHRLEILGDGRSTPLDRVQAVLRAEAGLMLKIAGSTHQLVLYAEPRTLDWLVTRIGIERAAHGSPADVPADLRVLAGGR